MLKFVALLKFFNRGGCFGLSWQEIQPPRTKDLGESKTTEVVALPRLINYKKRKNTVDGPTKPIHAPPPPPQLLASTCILVGPHAPPDLAFTRRHICPDAPLQGRRRRTAWRAPQPPRSGRLPPDSAPSGLDLAEEGAPKIDFARHDCLG